MRYQIAGPARALAAIALACAGSIALADSGRTLRLMPRTNAGDPDVPVSEAQRLQWEAIAGIELHPSARTPTGAWLVDVPAEVSGSRLASAIAALRRQAGILWVDDKPVSVRQTPPRPASAVPASRLMVRTRADFASRAAFAPGTSGWIGRREVERATAEESIGYTVERITATGHALLRLDTPVDYAKAVEYAATLGQRAGVRYAEAVGRAVALRTPNDSQLNDQWSLSNVDAGINAAAAWEITTGGPVTVAVIDTGVLPHPDLAGKILPGYDFISDPATARDGDGRDPDATDPGDASTADDACGARRSSWHGTFVSGIIAAATNNGLGIAGVSWGAKILPVRVLGKCGGTFDDVIDGMLWASGAPVDGVPSNPHPARILNMSLGAETGGCPAFMQEAIDMVIARGALPVVAAGNSLTDVYDEAPAGCGGVVSVAALGRGGDLASYSNSGIKADIGAPGGDNSALPTQSLVLGLRNAGSDRAGAFAYGYGAGTSFAAPHVAGVLALVLTRNPDLSPGQMLNILIASARAYRQDTRCGAPAGNAACGAGLVDAAAALQMTPLPGSAQPADLVNVVEFYNSTLAHYFMTASPLEMDSIDRGVAGPGWKRTGFSFRSFAVNGAPLVAYPVCRFYGVGPNSHFYSALPAECANVLSASPGWTFEGWAFGAGLPEAGICRAGYKPVYRAYNGRGAVDDANHRYLIDPFEYVAMQQQGWQPEGVVMCAVND